MNSEKVSINTTHTPNEEEILVVRKRIGSTTFIVNIHFNKTSSETMEDKIIRLLKMETSDVI